MTEPRRGGRQIGVQYELGRPRSLGEGNWPHTRYDDVTPEGDRYALEVWRDLVADIRTQRQVLGLTQQDAAAAAGIAANTLEAIERGDSWGSVPNLLRLLHALGLELEQTTEVRVRRRKPGSR